MSDYQAIYDAVRSSIFGGDIGSVVREVASRSFDISFATSSIRDEFVRAGMEMQRPSVLFRPTIAADGDQWCALLGDDLQSGVAGFGDTPAKAMEAFDEAFWRARTPSALLSTPDPQP